MKRLLLLVICALTFGTAAHSQRLPDNVVPETYDLTFTPDLVKATFSGEESIHVTLRRPAASIVLNSAEIDFQEATITAGGSTQTATVSKNENLEQATLTVPKELSAGPAEIRIRFTGIPRTIERVLAATPEAHPATIAEVLAADWEARQRAHALLA